MAECDIIVQSRLISLRTLRLLRNKQVQPYTAAGYTYVGESGDKAGKSACLNTADIHNSLTAEVAERLVNTCARMRVHWHLPYHPLWSCSGPDVTCPMIFELLLDKAIDIAKRLRG